MERQGAVRYAALWRGARDRREGMKKTGDTFCRCLLFFYRMFEFSQDLGRTVDRTNEAAYNSSI